MLSLRDLLLVDGEGSVTCGLRRQFFHVIDKLDFVSLIDGGKCNLNGIKLSLVDAHSGKSRPKSVLLNETAKTDCLLEISLLNVLVKNARVGAHLESSEATIESADGAKGASEAGHHGKLADIEAFSSLLRLKHQVTVNVDSIRVEPSDVLAVSDCAKHIICIVPAEGINHVRNLVNFRLVNQSQEHVSVVVNKAHLALRGHLDLVQLHLNDFSGVLNLLGSRLSRLDIEDTHDLGRHGVNQCEHIRRERNVTLVQELNSKTLVLGR